MHIRCVRKMKVVKALTLVSLINKVCEFFLKSNKHCGRIKKKGLIMKNVQKQPEKIDRSISMHIKLSVILKFSKLKF